MWLLWVLACGGSDASAKLDGCWEALPKRKATECFHPDGKYTVVGQRLGGLEGRWTVSGDTVSIAVAGMKPDVYTIGERDGHLLLTNDKRELELVKVEQ